MLLSYSVALLSTTLALGIALLLGFVIAPIPTSPFFVAVMVSAWLGGLGPGLLATVLSTLAINYCCLPPPYSLAFDDLNTLVRLGAFIIASFLISGLNQARWSAIHREKRLRAASETAQRETQVVKERLGTVLSSISDGFYTLDRDWCYTYANDRYCHMVEREREQLLGENFWALFPCTLGTSLESQFQQAMVEQIPAGFEYLHLPWQYWYEYRVYPSPDGLTVFIADITERKQTEAEREQLLQTLAAERAQFEAVLSQMPAGVLIADAASGNLILSNEQAHQLLRYTQAIDIKLDQYLPNIPLLAYRLDGQPYAADEYPLARSLRTGETIRHEEIEIRYPDGSRIVIDTNASAVLNDRGEIISAVAVFQDITQRQHTEIALRQSEERLRVALKNAPITVFNQDLDLRYTWIENPAFGDLEGTVLGKGDRDLANPEEAAILTRIKRQVLETGIGTREECKLTHLGQAYYYDLTIEPLKETSGNVIGVTGAAIDITPLKQTELALRHSEERFRLLAERVRVIPWEVDPATGQFTYVGPQVVEILGYPLEEWYIQDFWTKQMYVRDREWVPQLCYENSLILDNYDFEYRMVAADGRIVWLYDVVNVVRQGDRPQLLRGIMIDITQRKRHEEAQQYLAQFSKALASSLDYQTILNQLAYQLVPHLADWCVVQVVQDDGSIEAVATAHSNPEKIQWADEIRQRYPINPDDPTGTPRVLRTGQSEFYPHITDELLVQSARDEEHLRLLREVGFRSAMIVPMPARGKILGTLVFVAAESARQYDPEDLAFAEELGRHAALAVDNAQLYQKAQQAQQIAERLAHRTAILQQITAAFSQALTPKQVAEVVTQRAIAAMEAKAGSLALLIDEGRTLQIVQAVGYPESMLNTWSSFPANSPVPIAETARTQNPVFIGNRERFVERYPHLAQSATITQHQAWACLPLSVEDRLLGVIGLSFSQPQTFDSEDRIFMLTLAQQCAQAIARTDLYEAEQRARNAAEAANRVKDEFLAVVSHELRSPLNPILGWSKFLLNGKLDADRTQQALSAIERNARLQSELIEDLLDVSRILRGKLSLNASSVNLASTIQAAIETVRLAAEAKSIEMNAFLDPQVGRVWGDATRLQQVVWNLLSNAVKFTPPNGQIEVKLERLSDTPPQSFAQIVVADTGKGIATDFLPHVFDYFRQADSTTTRKFGGLGLGLAIVRHLVELHGGTIQVDSPGEGLGATFTVRLPLMSVQEDSPLEVAGSHFKLDLSGVRVLVVDDEADTREFVTFLLEEAGAIATTVTSAEEVLSVLAQSQPDVLLSDIGMPGIDGYMLMQRIRALPPERGGQVKAIALTAYAGKFDRHRALAAGFQQHLSKPVEPEGLIRAIAQMLHST
ncbi:PAS domain S-box protein [Geitlerinema splendidum]|nr:PAS domain S-box protein [Geitlerinema splendidum]